MKICKKCGKKNPDIVMIKKTCYICILKQWPPKNRKQYRKYENAVAIRLLLTTPISSQKGAMDIVRRIGINNLLKIQEIIDGVIVSHKPGNTFEQRLKDKMED
jgi:hypothetical protein